MTSRNLDKGTSLYHPKYYVDWKEKNLYDLAEWKNGLAFRKINFSDTGKPVIKIAELKNGITRQTNYTKDDFDKSVYLTKGDMVFSWSGNPETSIDVFWYNLPHGWLNQHIFKIFPSEIINKHYLFYTLKYLKPNFQSIASNKQTTGLGHVTIRDLKQIKVRLPELNEQKAIANILSTLDEKIETNNQINEKLEEMAQALFKHWFVDFEFPNENGKPYKSSGGEMVESELGMIPKGWEVGKLGELVEISNKSIKPQEYPEKFFEHYSIPAFDNGRTPEIQKGEEIKSSKYVINNHMVLVSKLNPSTKRIWKPITQTNNAICSTEFIVYMAKKENILSYVFEFLNNEKFQGILTANATGSTGSRQRVKPKETLNYKVVLPPLKLMRQFSKIIEPMHLKIGSNMIENQKLKGLRDILLPKLISGEIRVPLDDEVLSEKN
ncbi:restriction endonuclease subunit S [Heyndrickxia coagulans]|uniref:restriction endonuclease subunit S n=1 Tax=Heyndrickxia coagulans TaxID=1398 RepID=UPI000211067D|nr:restriction endonuclease subunit S [Heyndrickxia coagulans]AEH54994.1 Putative Type I restriction modification system, specificity protein [Heyndrickxia coagulans 2-6]